MHEKEKEIQLKKVTYMLDLTPTFAKYHNKSKPRYVTIFCDTLLRYAVGKRDSSNFGGKEM